MTKTEMAVQMTLDQAPVLAPILLISPNPYQPEGRLKFPDEIVLKMAASIQESGLLQLPVVRLKPGASPDVTSRENAYEMADGWLRLCAYRCLAEEKKLKGYNAIPVIVRELSDRQMADMVMESQTREEMSPIDRARFYKKYLEDFKITQEELAKRHSCSQGEIANTLRLLDLPEDIQGKIISREISETHGRALLRLNSVPELQKELTERSMKQNLTVNELDREINENVWRGTRSLKPNDYGFDVKTCYSCSKRIMAADPWGDQKKQYRCADTACWDKKQDEAEAARAAKVQEKTGESNGVTKILTGNDLSYNQYERLDGDTKKLDNPEECKTCDKTALYRYRADDTYKPERVCLNPNCFRQKKARKTREVHKVEKQQDQELTAKLGETFRGLSDHKAITVVMALDLLGYKKLNMDGEADMLAYFPDLPADKKKRLDDAAVKKWLSDRPLDELLRICAAAVITHSRRQSAGFYSTKLDGNAKENYAILTASPKQEAVTNVTRQDMTAPPPGLIPEGVRMAEDVPDEECKNCNLNTEDHTVDHKFLVGNVSHKVCLKDYRAAIAKQERAKEFEVDRTDLGEQEMLDFQFRNCDGCHWADQEKVGTGKPCCTCLVSPHIVEGECLTKQVKGTQPDSTSDNASDNEDPLATFELRVSKNGNGKHKVTYRGSEYQSVSLITVIQLALGALSVEKCLELLKTYPDSENKKLLIGILEGR